MALFIAVLVLGVIGQPLAADAQQAQKTPRIGMLLTFSPEDPSTRHVRDAFRQGLRELGYVEGQNILIEYRFAQGRTEQFPELVADLVRLKVDVIVASSTPAARAAKQATNTIPIVGTAMADPVGDGLVVSLARPGGNLTGLTFLGSELVPKRLELLKEVIAGLSRVAVLWQPGVFDRMMADMVKETEVASQTLGVQLQLQQARGPDEFNRAFSAMRRERAEALVVFPSPLLYSEYRRIVDLAARYRFPAIYYARAAVEAGGLMAYGASIPGLNRQAAIYVDKLLKGAKPADLPVEQPSKFELVINLKTAKALGLPIPQSVLIRADEVIQ